MACERCDAEVPTRRLVLRQNVGALVRRLPRRFEGQLCRACVSERYWSVTMVNRTLGVLGLISLFVALAYDVRNLVALFRARGLGRAHRQPRRMDAVREGLLAAVEDVVACWSGDRRA